MERRNEITYDEFRTGLSFKEVRDMLRYEQRPHITRHTVLGKWHEIKLSMYRSYENSIKKDLDLSGFINE